MTIPPDFQELIDDAKDMVNSVKDGMFTTKVTKVTWPEPATAPAEICCKELHSAVLDSSIWRDTEGWVMASPAGLVSFCPWCGSEWKDGSFWVKVPEQVECGEGES